MAEPAAPEMIHVPGGTFASAIRGGASGDPITVTEFRLARTQTTTREFALFCADSGRSIGLYTPRWGLSDDDPVVNVNWYDAVAYANWSSVQAGLEPAYAIDEAHEDPHNENEYDQLRWTVRADWRADGFRLPTEAEWEYAARGGPDGRGYRFAGSDDIDDVGWFAGNSDGRTHGVAGKRPNELSLYDLSGNANEWCWDWFAEAPAAADDDPRGPESGTFRVVRGGSCNDSEDLCTVANRNYANPHVRHHSYGLRLAQNG